MSRYKISIWIAIGLLLFGGQMEAFSSTPGKIKIFNAASGQIEELDKVSKTDAQWKSMLTPEQYNVMRLKGTEIPFAQSCALPKKNETGVYRCAGCGTDLFLVQTKFESGTGWPSFWQPVSELNIRTQLDYSAGQARAEVLCARCQSHLGHVFDDGPPPSGKRYCMNAVALKFAKINLPEIKQFQKAAFAAGCFWGVQSAFGNIKGVLKVTAGYSGGNLKNPSYEEVCTGKTGHAETVELEFNPEVVTYEKLLDLFWSLADPASLNMKKIDPSGQYRFIIFYYTPQQKEAALASKKKFETATGYHDLAVQIMEAKDFYKAESYHQDYYAKHGLKPFCNLPKANGRR